MTFRLPKTFMPILSLALIFQFGSQAIAAGAELPTSSDELGRDQGEDAARGAEREFTLKAALTARALDASKTNLSPDEIHTLKSLIASKPEVEQKVKVILNLSLTVADATSRLRQLLADAIQPATAPSRASGTENSDDLYKKLFAEQQSKISLGGKGWDDTIATLLTQPGYYVEKDDGGVVFVGFAHTLRPLFITRVFPFLLGDKWDASSNFKMAVRAKLTQNAIDFANGMNSIETVKVGKKMVSSGMINYYVETTVRRPTVNSYMRMEIRSLLKMYDFITATTTPAQLEKIANGWFVPKLDKLIAKQVLDGSRANFAISNATQSAEAIGYSVADGLGLSLYQMEVKAGF